MAGITSGEKILAEVNGAKFFILYELKFMKILLDKNKVGKKICKITGYGVDLNGVTDSITFPEIKIPSEIDGAPVRYLGDAFLSSLEVYPYVNKSSSSERLKTFDDRAKIKIEKLILPDTIEVVKQYAFAESIHIKSISWPAKCDIPYGCFRHSQIKEITISEGVKEIDYGAFEYSQLEKITIPNGCTTIKQSAFEGCFHLKEINIPDTITTIEVGAFCGSGIEKISWPKNCKEVPPSCFANCQGLKEVVFSGNIDYINAKSFLNCLSLKKIDLSQVCCFTIASSDFIELMNITPNIVIPPIYSDIIAEVEE